MLCVSDCRSSLECFASHHLQASGPTSNKLDTRSLRCQLRGHSINAVYSEAGLHDSIL